MRGEDACFHSFWRSPSETPPRAWGRPSTPTQTDLAWRNTPTCVGKTYRLFHQQLAIEKHPHVRGEDDNPFPRVILNRETPPRAWGRPARQALLSSTRRNTPTCVGKTPAQRSRQSCHRKHPHVRGEDVVLAKDGGHTAETPPRAWGRPSALDAFTDSNGNTPTCVGKTLPAASRHTSTRKHPHVRGEDALQTSEETNQGETPPRAWGRPPEPLRQRAGCRNTPTCVGKTAAAGRMTRSSRKHPHVRGEDTK